MLSLGRKSGQYVVIGENIVVKVEGTKNGLKLLVGEVSLLIILFIRSRT